MVIRIVTVSELKIKLKALIDELEQRGIPLYVTQHGKPRAVLSKYDDYEAMVKRIEDLEDLLAMKESMIAPIAEAVSLKDYERKRAARVRS